MRVASLIAKSLSILAFSWSFAPAPYAFITLPSTPTHPKLLPPELEIYRTAGDIEENAQNALRRGNQSAWAYDERAKNAKTQAYISPSCFSPFLLMRVASLIA
jgi:hypothetical protein